MPTVKPNPTVYSEGNPQNKLPNNPRPDQNLSKPKLNWYKNKKLLMFIGGGVLIVGLIITLVLVMVNGNNGKTIVPETKTITLWLRDTDEEVMNGIITDFEKENPYIKVKLERQSETDYENRIKTRLKLKSTNMGNIIEIEESWVDELYLTISIINDQTVLGRYSKQAIKNNTVQNYPFAVPYSFDSLALAYNLDHIAEIGYNQESFNKLDWTVLSSRIKSLTKTVKTPVPGQNNQQYDQVIRSGIAFGSPRNVTNATEIIQLLLIQNDSTIYSNQTKQFKSDDRFTQVTNLYTGFAISNIWRENLGNDIEAFAEGKVSIVLVRSKDIDKIQALNPNLKFSTTIPAKIGGIQTLSLSKSLAVPNYMPNYNESMKFISYLTRAENGTKLYNGKKSTNTFIPAQLVSLNQIPQDSPFGVYSDLNSTAERFALPYYTDLTLAMENYFTEAYDSYYKNGTIPNANQSFKISGSDFDSKMNAALKAKTGN